MKIVKDINILPEKDLVLTMGFFDGMHRGHRFLIDHLWETAAAEGLGSSLLTFWPHPRTVLNVAYQPKLLNTIEERTNCCSSYRLIIVIRYLSPLSCRSIPPSIL